MEDNLVTGTADPWGAEPQKPGEEIHILTPEEEEALWADPVYGPRSGSDDDWDEDQPTGSTSRAMTASLSSTWMRRRLSHGRKS